MFKAWYVILIAMCASMFNANVACAGSFLTITETGTVGAGYDTHNFFGTGNTNPAGNPYMAGTSNLAGDAYTLSISIDESLYSSVVNHPGLMVSGSGVVSPYTASLTINGVTDHLQGIASSGANSFLTVLNYFPGGTAAVSESENGYENGAFEQASAWVFSWTDNFVSAADLTSPFIYNTTAADGQFAQFTDGANGIYMNVRGGAYNSPTSFSNDGSVKTVAVSEAPEPSSIALIGVGLAILGFVFRRSALRGH